MPGLLSHSPAQVMAQLLVDLGLGTTPNAGGDQTVWPVFYDNEPNTPNNVVTVSDTTGVTFAGDSFGGRNEHHGFQVKVRSGTIRGGYPKANAILVGLNQLRLEGPRIVAVEGVDYSVWQVRPTGGVMRLGPETNSTRRGYTVNGKVYVVQCE